MPKNTWKLVILTILLFYAVWLLGAFFGFLPFVGDDLVMREIAYCACMICVTIVLCSCCIFHKLDIISRKQNKASPENETDRTDPA